VRRYIEQTTQPDGTVTETPVDGIILTEREYQEQRDQLEALIVTADTFLQQAQTALDSLMDTYKAQRSIDRTYLKAFGLEDDPQSETILP
jgi:hypothetical protein